MRKLVVFYSFEGNTKLIAEAIAEKMGADILELKPKKEIKTKGFMKYVWGGRKVIFNEKPDLNPMDKNPEEYDVIVIGTPVWAFSYTPAIATFLSSVRLKEKKIGLFCCHEGVKGKVFSNMKNELEGNEFIGEIDFIAPLKKDKANALQKARQWAEELINRY